MGRGTSTGRIAGRLAEVGTQNPLLTSKETLQQTCLAIDIGLDEIDRNLETAETSIKIARENMSNLPQPQIKYKLGALTPGLLLEMLNYFLFIPEFLPDLIPTSFKEAQEQPFQWHLFLKFLVAQLPAFTHVIMQTTDYFNISKFFPKQVPGVIMKSGLITFGVQAGMKSLFIKVFGAAEPTAITIATIASALKLAHEMSEYQDFTVSIEQKKLKKLVSRVRKAQRKIRALQREVRGTGDDINDELVKNYLERQDKLNKSTGKLLAEIKKVTKGITAFAKIRYQRAGEKPHEAPAPSTRYGLNP